MAGNRSEGLLDVVFGYTLATSLLTSYIIGKPEQILYLSGVVGGFLSAFLYYIKPFDYAIRKRLSQVNRGYYWSPYLRPARTSILAGFYLAAASLIAVLSPATAQFITDSARGLVTLVVAILSISVLLVVLARWIWLEGKASLVRNYYTQLAAGQHTMTGNPLALLDKALRDEDWEQAAILERSIQIVELPEPDKWERGLNRILEKLKLYRKNERTVDRPKPVI